MLELEFRLGRVGVDVVGRCEVGIRVVKSLKKG